MIKKELRLKATVSAIIRFTYGKLRGESNYNNIESTINNHQRNRTTKGIIKTSSRARYRLPTRDPYILCIRSSRNQIRAGPAAKETLVLLTSTHTDTGSSRTHPRSTGKPRAKGEIKANATKLERAGGQAGKKKSPPRTLLSSELSQAVAILRARARAREGVKVGKFRPGHKVRCARGEKRRARARATGSFRVN